MTWLIVVIVSIAINLGADLSNMTTANLDMLRQYRAETNVVNRPPGRGIQILGQHEILLPLLRQGVLAKLGAAGWVRATYITEDTAILASAANERYAEWHSRTVEAASAYDDVELDATTRRALNLIKLR